MKLQAAINTFITRLQQPLFCFSLFSVITLVLYRNTIGCRLVTDALNWIIIYNQQGFSGIANSFGDISQHYSYHFLFYGLYSLFGVNEIGYFIVFSLVHALNATLLFVVIKKYLQMISVKHFTSISLLASVLFLLQPYQTEAVVWGATIHYLVLTSIFLLIFNLQLRRIENGNSRITWLIVILYVFAIFLHIITITFPVLIALLLYPANKFSIKKTWNQVWPLVLIAVAYIVSNYLIVDSATGHKAGYTENAITFTGFISKTWNYILKDFFLLQFTPYTVRAFAYSFTTNGVSIFGGIALLLVCIILFLFQRNKNPALQISTTFLLAFIVALIPALPLYFYFLTPIESDRFIYFPLVFSSVVISIIIYQFRSYLRWGIMFFVLVIYLFFLNKNISAWADSAQLQKSMEHNFPVNTSGTTYLLNVPDNIRGAYLYRESHVESKLAESIVFKHQKDMGDVFEVMQYNPQQLTDGVDAIIIDSNTLQISFAQYGNWWWMEGKGATDYSDDFVTVTIAEDGISYTVQFKQKKPGDTFVYLKDMEWQTLNNF